MMISKKISASPDSAQWQSINWKAVESHVLKLQMRIAKATGVFQGSCHYLLNYQAASFSGFR